ncbi:MAG: FAD binding domain-containing protein [Acidimicrobiia bacterium]|nr:FAD binding domain-containing protein [Acidimicrobiia bacterium]
MPSVVAYHRPETLDEAASLAADPNRRLLAGGTVIVPASRTIGPIGVELVDLQGLDLNRIEASVDDGDRLRIGSMCRLGELLDDPSVPALLQVAARRELPSTLRYQATIGGTVALGPIDSMVVAGLLVHDATVEFHDDEPLSLGSMLAAGVGDRIITAVTIAIDGTGALVATGRTPADDPIVAAVARTSDEGNRLALTGVAATPIEVDPADPANGLDPPGDFRGSADYRRHLAGVLSRRALAQLDPDAGAGGGR